MAKDKSTSVYFDRTTLAFVGLDAAHIKQLKDAYPGVDVDSELKKMILWLTSPKGAKRKGNIGFIVNWLNNVNPVSSFPLQDRLDLKQDSPLRPYINEYLQELWKGREHILEMNTRKEPI